MFLSSLIEYIYWKIFFQTFAVPGSVFLNILAGALFGVWQGFLLCCLLTACGASQCYLLARMVGADTAQHYFPDKIASFKAKLEENRVNIYFWLTNITFATSWNNVKFEQRKPIYLAKFWDHSMLCKLYTIST